MSSCASHPDRIFRPVRSSTLDILHRTPASYLPAGFSGLWRIDQSVRDTTTKRQLEALRRLDSFTDASQPAPGEVLLRLALLGSRHAAYISEQPPVWVREDRWRADARAALAGQEGLNDSQRRAIAGAMVRTVSLWQGPPGGWCWLASQEPCSPVESVTAAGV